MRKVMFVCTGNTCRSPMAEMAFTHIIKNKNIKNVCAKSCGIYAVEGMKMCEYAKFALEKKGIKTHEHKSKRLTKDLLKDCVLAVGMTDAHANICSEYVNSVSLADFNNGKEITDPYGGDKKVYEECLDVIYVAIEKLVGEHFIMKNDKKS